MGQIDYWNHNTAYHTELALRSTPRTWANAQPASWPPILPRRTPSAKAPNCNAYGQDAPKERRPLELGVKNYSKLIFLFLQRELQAYEF